MLVTVEVLSALMFLGFVLTRAMNPDLWHPDRGGEKPFEMALLTAVLRTKTLPVYDPWYSHGALNYYYGGWFLLSAPARAPAHVADHGHEHRHRGVRQLRGRCGVLDRRRDGRRDPPGVA